MGMSAEEFWHGDPELASGYREAWKMRMQSTYLAEWRQGYYFLESLATMLDKDHQYPEEPLFTTETPDEVEERRAKQAMERMKEAFVSRVAQLAANKNDRQEAV